MKYLSLALIFMFWGSGAGLFSAGSGLKLVKAIGDDRDDYTFFQLTSAVMSNQKEIFVSDGKGHFISKYDWQGKFIKRIGQRGQGNGDFINPGSLNISDSRLYIIDKENYRIAWTNLDLSRLDYYRLATPAINMKTLSNFVVLRHGFCIGSSFESWNDKGRIILLDWISNKCTAFFNHYPIDPGKRIKDIYKTTRESFLYEGSLSFMSLPVFGFDRKQGLLLISFQYPDNPVKLFLYTKEGKEIKMIEYSIEKQYKFPRHYLDRSLSKPKEFYDAVVDSIYSFNGKFLVFFEKNRHQRGKPGERVEQFCLVMDKNGKILEKFPVENGCKPFFISEDGYVLAKNFEAEEEQLLIYKLNLVK